MPGFHESSRCDRMRPRRIGAEMRVIRVSGLKSCDSTRAALKALDAAGKTAEFRDLRDEPPDAAEIARLWEAVGPALLNRASATWRGLPEAERAGDPLALLVTYPTLIKRPVIEGEAGVTAGWGPAQRGLWLD
jgi:arsenate reductase-like glutaredoxin family protein